jgi:hypothetical protein
MQSLKVPSFSDSGILGSFGNLLAAIWETEWVLAT